MGRKREEEGGNGEGTPKKCWPRVVSTVLLQHVLEHATGWAEGAAKQQQLRVRKQSDF